MDTETRKIPRQLKNNSLGVDLELQPPGNSDTETESVSETGSWPEASDVEREWVSEPENADSLSESDSDTSDESDDDLDDDDLAGRDEFSEENIRQNFQFETTGDKIKLLSLDELRRYEEGLGPEDQNYKHAHLIVEEHLAGNERTECHVRLEIGSAYKQIREYGAANRKLLDIYTRRQKREQEIFEKFEEKIERSERRRMKEKKEAEKEIALLELLLLNKKAKLERISQENYERVVAKSTAEASPLETDAEREARLAQVINNSENKNDAASDIEDEEESDPESGTEVEVNDPDLKVQDCGKAKREDDDLEEDEYEDGLPLKEGPVQDQMMPEPGHDEEEKPPEKEEQNQISDAVPESFDMNSNKEEPPIPSQLKAEFSGFNQHEHDLIRSMTRQLCEERSRAGKKNDTPGTSDPVIIISDSSDEDAPILISDTDEP